MTLFPERKKVPPKAPAPKTFSERVVALALKIPPGRVSTYSAIARAAGSLAPMSARAVTGILGKASERGEKHIPFHRVVYSDGRVWMSGEHRNKRLRLYKEEGIELGQDDRIVNFADRLYEF